MKNFIQTLATASFVLLFSATSCFGAAKPTLTPEEIAATEAAIMEHFQTMFGFGLTVEPKAINIFDAIEAGTIEHVNEALKNPESIESKNENNQTPLHVAVHSGKTEIAKALLEAGANIEAVNNVGWTVLFVAVQAHNKEMIELLKTYKANPHAEIVYPFDQTYWVTPRALLINLKNISTFSKRPVDPGTDQMISFLEVWEKEYQA
ncbi:ankyrin repeat domain-containing protein [Candidatus Babeliales bacterium]|nr:ankyrin repeat domain-containing protein [Candidatus Babeliales bacterium]